MNNSGIFCHVSLPVLRTAECADLKHMSCLISQLRRIKKRIYIGKSWKGEQNKIVGAKESLPRKSCLTVVIQIELMRMGSGIDGFDFFFHLPVQPVINHIFGENIAFE